MRNTAAMLNVTEKGLTVFCVDRFTAPPRNVQCQRESCSNEWGWRQSYEASGRRRGGYRILRDNAET